MLVALGIGIGWGLYGDTSSPLSFTTDPGAKSDGIEPVVLTPPRQLHSLGGLTGLIEQMRKKFGDTIGYRLVVYPEYASLDRPDPGEDRRKLNHTYRGGWGDPTSSAKGGDDIPVDLSAFDVKAVVRHIARGARNLGYQERRRPQHLPDIRPRRRQDGPGRRHGDLDLRLQRLRQRLHRAQPRRQRQADQLPVLIAQPHRERIVTIIRRPAAAFGAGGAPTH